MFSPPADPARPFVTFYDDATDDRVELSYASFGNWVAKTANLIQDTLLARAGELIAIYLPPHWQTLVWLVACWDTGLVAAPRLDPAAADHVVVGPDALDRADACSGRRIALALRPLGGPFQQQLPDGVLDYGAEVHGQPDRFVAYPEPVADRPALIVADRIFTRGELVSAGRGAAADLSLDQTSRVLTDRDPSAWAGVRDAVLAPLAAGASLVLCRNLDPTRLARRTASERITHSVF